MSFRQGLFGGIITGIIISRVVIANVHIPALVLLGMAIGAAALFWFAANRKAVEWS